MEIIKTFEKETSSLSVYGSFETPLFLANQIGAILGLVKVRTTLANMDKDYMQKILI